VSRASHSRSRSRLRDEALEKDDLTDEKLTKQLQRAKDWKGLQNRKLKDVMEEAFAKETHRLPAGSTQLRSACIRGYIRKRVRKSWTHGQ
jgi:hypothetical protein